MQSPEHTTTRLPQVWQNIRKWEKKYRREAGSVGLLAVSKRRTVAEIRRLAAAAQRDFGENYLQEAQRKLAVLDAGPGAGGLSWHFIGAVQSNKAGQIARRFAWVHSVDRAQIARRLSAARPPNLPPLNVCVQVNISGERSKSGVTAEQLPAMVGLVRGLPRLTLRGLMALPAPGNDFAGQCAAFSELRGWFEALRGSGAAAKDWDTLSMGTSADMESAIASGSTLLRLGTALFGPRPS